MNVRILCDVRREVTKPAVTDATDEQRRQLTMLGAMRGGDPALLAHCLVSGGKLPFVMAQAVAEILDRPLGELFDVQWGRGELAAASTSLVKGLTNGPTVGFRPEGHVGPPVRGGRR